MGQIGSSINPHKLGPFLLRYRFVRYITLDSSGVWHVPACNCWGPCDPLKEVISCWSRSPHSLVSVGYGMVQNKNGKGQQVIAVVIFSRMWLHISTYTRTSTWDFDRFFSFFVSVAPKPISPIPSPSRQASSVAMEIHRSPWVLFGCALGRNPHLWIHQHSAAQHMQKVESSTSIMDALGIFPWKLQKDHKILLSIIKKYEKPPHKLSATIYHHPKRHWVLIIPQCNHTTSSLILHKIPLKFQYIIVQLKSKYHKYHVYIYI